MSASRGQAYELQAAAALRAHGFEVEHLSAEKYHASDFKLSPGVLLECKGSRLRRSDRNRTSGYKFVLENPGNNLPVYEQAVILVCETPAGPEFFVIPSDMLSTHYISITSADPKRYRGKWHIYRNAFDLLSELGANRKRPN